MFSAMSWDSVAFFGAVMRIQFSSVGLYVLDELPSLVFLSAYTLLLAMWADVWYCAVDADVVSAGSRRRCAVSGGWGVGGG
jgi:hypothetical protein